MEVLGPGAVKRLKRLARRNPVLALRSAALLGSWLGPGSFWAPSPEEIAGVLGERHPRAVRAIQRRIAANTLRNVIHGVVRDREGVAGASRRVRVRGAENLLSLHRRGVPVVAVVAHVGAGNAGIFDVLGVRGRAASISAAPRSQVVAYENVDDPIEAARFLRRSLRDLREGVVPILPFDGAVTGRLRTCFLGRELEVGRGLPFLAMRGARLVPITNRWVANSARIETTIHPPFPQLGPNASDEEQVALVEAIAHWFEDYVRRNPGELVLWKLRDLHASKPAARPERLVRPAGPRAPDSAASTAE